MSLFDDIEVFNEPLDPRVVDPGGAPLPPVIHTPRSRERDVAAQETVATQGTDAQSPQAAPQPEGPVVPARDPNLSTPVAQETDRSEGRWPDAVLGAFAMHIGGGTSEVQRNIIGEKILGLPR